MASDAWWEFGNYLSNRRRMNGLQKDKHHKFAGEDLYNSL